MKNQNDTSESAAGGVTRRQAIVGGATAAGIVSMTLPSMASAASEAGPATTTTVAVADPSATSAVPSTTVDGTVEVTGSDTF